MNNILGAHMSIAGGVHKALQRGASIQCDAIQLFVKNNKTWDAPPLTEEIIELFRKERQRSGLAPLVCHAGYLINLAAPEIDKLERSRAAMLDEMQRCESLGIEYIVVHPGSHKKTGEAEGIARIAESLDWLHERTDGFSLTVLLETTAGQGSNLGFTFNQLGQMIDQCGAPDRVGICLDTCHVFAAGYDFRSKQGYLAMIEEFDRELGIDKLKALHFNDSQNDLDSRRDRHDHIGAGYIGLEGFRWFMNDERLSSVPKLLETPKGEDSQEDVENMMVLRGLVEPGVLP